MNSLLTLSLVLGFSALLVSSNNLPFEKNFKPGFCPPPIGPAFCVFTCSSDSNCPGAQKCCTNSCGGTNCMDPITLPIAKAGVCPNTSGIITTCIWGPLNCLSDAACGANQKCCPYGCSSICMNVV